MYSYKLRESDVDPNVWAVLILAPKDEQCPAQGLELFGVVTFQGALANEWAAEYLAIKTETEELLIGH